MHGKRVLWRNKKLMEFGKVLRVRKSVRKFSSKGISWKVLARILEAGTLAPSSGNVQNWVFVVVADSERRKRLVNSLPSEQGWAADAPVLIVVASDNEQVKKLYGERGEKVYAIQNCAAAVENMLLCAADLGVGSCWIGYFDEKKVAFEVDLPEFVRPQAVIALGYGELVDEKGREPLQSFVFFERYGNKRRDVGVLPLVKRGVGRR